jgi:DNA repair protein RecO (recombination protein O)
VGPLRTEAIVLRSLRYGEADRILHLYTPMRGRVSAIAKGVRRTRSRFGGRLEPFSLVDLQLHEGRSDLLTVTGADTIRSHAHLRDAAAARLFESGDPHPEVFHLLGNELRLLEDEPAMATLANQLAFRLKLLVAAGFGPQLSACASCGEREHLVGFSGAAGGVVCEACEASAFALDEGAHGFMVQALGRPLAQTPQTELRALRQVERAVTDLAEHHGHVRLRAAAAG